MMNASPEEKSPSLLHGIARLISLALAVTTSLTILLAPRLIADESSHVPHGYLVLTMLGVCLSWVHAFDYRPNSPWLKLCFHPITAWGLLIFGACSILRNSTLF